MKHYATILCVLALFAFSSSTHGDILNGSLNDFQDGTLQGWSGGTGPSNVATGGPAGVGDRFLQIGNGGNLATYNTGFNGAIGSGVTAFQVDMMRPSGESAIEMRLVLFGPGTGNRWTSTAAQITPGNGDWDTYTFSLLEADLTQVLGTAGYADLTSGVNRVMFRYDPGTPSSSGTAVAGTLGLDNIRVIPEPASLALIALGTLAILRRRISITASSAHAVRQGE